MLANYHKDKIYVIAEIGGNFTNFDEAVELIDAAKRCGADAVKLQTYRAENLSSKKAMFNMENTGVISQYELFEKYSIDEKLHRQVFAYANNIGIDIFSSPSHVCDLKMLEELGCQAYKVGSDDAVNLPLLKNMAKSKKKIFFATGMCTLDEVRNSVNCFLEQGNDDIVIMHAITAYPTHENDVNLQAIKTLQREFPEFSIGYSDHTLGIEACQFAVAMGAQVIEKHFTIDKCLDGPDHQHSANPNELDSLIRSIRRFEIMRGDGIKRPVDGEKVNRINNRKSIVLLKDIKEGDFIHKEDVDIKRPGDGIEPKYLECVIGCIASKDLKCEDTLKWGDIR